MIRRNLVGGVVVGEVTVVGSEVHRDDCGGWLALVQPGTGKVWKRVRRSVLVGVVAANLCTPLLPSFGFGSRFALQPGMGEVGERVRGPVLVGVVVSDLATPLTPGLGVGGRLALVVGKAGNLVGGRVLVGVVVANALSPLRPSC